MKYIVKDYDTRYFAGIELIGGFQVGTNDLKIIPELWNDLESLYMNDISNKRWPISKIGLEIYRYDFMESKMVDYYATIETDVLIDVDDESLVTKKLPKGKYVLFPINREDIPGNIKRIYRFIQGENINVHLGFHIEIYEDSTLNTDNETMYLSFKLEEKEKAK